MAQLMSSGDDTTVKQAEERLRKLLETAPSTPEMLNTLAFAEMRLGKVEEAIETLEQALVQTPNELNSAVLLVRAKLAQKDVAGAEAVLKKAAASMPNSPHPHVILGRF